MNRVLISPYVGRVSGIFSNEVYAGMMIVIALTRLLPPFIMKRFHGRYGDCLQAGSKDEGNRGGGVKQIIGNSRRIWII